MKYIIGVDIGGTKIAVTMARALSRPEIAAKRTFPTDVRGPGQTLESLYTTIERLIAEQGTSNADCTVGISCGGPLDSRSGVILGPPNLIGWNEVPIVKLLERRLNCPAYLQNDANACALAEWKLGAGVGLDNIVFLTFGTGLGAGLILNGRLYEGASGNAGEAGHIRLSTFGPVGYGKPGSFEGFCSGGGIRQLARTHALAGMQSQLPPLWCLTPDQLDKVDAAKVFEYAQRGDPDALAIVRICGEQLGRGLALIIDLLNPDAIILGSIFARQEELLRRYMEPTLTAEALSVSASACRIMPAALGEELGDYAALYTAIYGLERSGS